MKRFFSLFIALVALLCCGQGYGDTKVSNIKTLEDLNTVLSEMGTLAENERYLMILDETQDLNLYGDVIRKSFWMDYAHHWHYRYWENKSKIIFTLELKESMRILSAILDKKRISKLMVPERLALKQIQNTLEKCKMPGTRRIHKIMMLQDDLRFNSQISTKRYGKKRQGTFAAFVLHRKGDTGTLAEYMQVMLTALDIPNHTYDTSGKSINMVQLDNGEWYFIKRMGFEVIDLPKDDKNTPKFPAQPAACDIKVPTYDSPKDFWIAADEAQANGEKCLGALIKNYPGSKKVKEAYTQHLAKEGLVIRDDMYLPSDAGGTRYVCVTFAEHEEVDEAQKQDDTFAPEETHRRSAKKSKKRKRN